MTGDSRLLQRSTNVGLASRERSLAFATKIDSIGHNRSFKLPIPSDMLLIGFITGILKDGLECDWRDW